jgi:hypothetical protein
MPRLQINHRTVSWIHIHLWQDKLEKRNCNDFSQNLGGTLTWIWISKGCDRAFPLLRSSTPHFSFSMATIIFSSKPQVNFQDVIWKGATCVKEFNTHCLLSCPYTEHNTIKPKAKLGSQDFPSQTLTKTCISIAIIYKGRVPGTK